MKMTLTEAVKMVANRLLANAIPGARPYDLERLKAATASATEDGADYHLGVEWERSWTVGCSLSVNLRNRGPAMVTITWSSTGRSPAEAVAAASLYAQVAVLACEIEALLSRVEVEN